MESDLAGAEPLDIRLGRGGATTAAAVPTVALNVGSFAIDSGSTNLTTDATGYTRAQGAAPDRGAFESRRPIRPARRGHVSSPRRRTPKPTMAKSRCARHCLTSARAAAPSLSTHKNSPVRQTITLNGNALPDVSGAVAVVAPRAGRDRFGRAAQSRIFRVLAGGDLTLQSLTLTGGNAEPKRRGATISMGAAARFITRGALTLAGLHAQRQHGVSRRRVVSGGRFERALDDAAKRDFIGVTRRAKRAAGFTCLGQGARPWKAAPSRAIRRPLGSAVRCWGGR